MAKIFPIIVRRIQEIVGGANGFIASVIKAGLAMTNRFRLIGGDIKSGIFSEASRFTGEGSSTPQTPAVDTVLLGIDGEVSESVDPAPAILPSIRDVAGTSIPQIPAFGAELLGVEGEPVLMGIDSAVAIAESLRDVAATNTPQIPAIESALLGVEGEAVLMGADPAGAVVQSLRDVAGTSTQQTPAIASAQSLQDAASTNTQQTPAVAAAQSLRDMAGTSTPQTPAFSSEQSLQDVAGTSTPQVPAVDTDLLGIEGEAFHFEAAPAAAIIQSLRDMAGTSTPQNPAVTAAQSLQDVAGTSTPQTPAVDTALLAATGTAANMPIGPAMNHEAVIHEQKTSEIPAFELVQFKVDLTHRSGSNSVTEANGTGGRQDFDTPANAAGLHNGTLCTCTGNLLGARNGRLNMAYADFANKSSLTITEVLMHFYYKQTSLLAAACTGGYNFGGSDTQLFSHAALSSVDYTSTPNTFDVTTAVGGSWTNLNAIRAWIDAEISALALNDSVSMDAVELEITATRTDSL